MTVTAWHDPIPDAVNMRLNVMKYLASYAFLDFSYADDIFVPMILRSISRSFLREPIQEPCCRT